MIASIHTGGGFRGALEYNFDKSKDAEIVGGNMAGSNPRELSREFGETRHLREDIEKPVYHVSLSLKPGETLRNDQWREATEQYMKGMGFEKSQYIALKHNDKDHEHVHIVASKIGYEGKLVDTSKDYSRSQVQVRELERMYNLERIPSSHETDRKQYSRGELEQVRDSGEPSTKAQLLEAIDRASADKPTMSEFVERLEKDGVRAVPNYQSSGKLNGMSYELEGVRVKGSDLGRAYTAKGLQERRGVEYRPERDDIRCRQAAEKSASNNTHERQGKTEIQKEDRDVHHDGAASANDRGREAPERGTQRTATAPERKQEARQDRSGAGADHRNPEAKPVRPGSRERADNPNLGRIRDLHSQAREYREQARALFQQPERNGWQRAAASIGIGKTAIERAGDFRNRASSFRERAQEHFGRATEHRERAKQSFDKAAGRYQDGPALSRLYANYLAGDERRKEWKREGWQHSQQAKIESGRGKSLRDSAREYSGRADAVYADLRSQAGDLQRKASQCRDAASAVSQEQFPAESDRAEIEELLEEMMQLTEVLLIERAEQEEFIGSLQEANEELLRNDRGAGRGESRAQEFVRSIADRTGAMERAVPQEAQRAQHAAFRATTGNAGERIQRVVNDFRSRIEGGCQKLIERLGAGGSRPRMSPETTGKMLNRIEEHVQRLPERLRNDLREAVHQLQEKVSTLRGSHQTDAPVSERMQQENPKRQARPESQPQSGRDSIYNHGYQSPNCDQQRPGSSREEGVSGERERSESDRDR